MSRERRASELRRGAENPRGPGRFLPGFALGPKSAVSGRSLPPAFPCETGATAAGASRAWTRDRGPPPQGAAGPQARGRAELPGTPYPAASRRHSLLTTLGDQPGFRPLVFSQTGTQCRVSPRLGIWTVSGVRARSAKRPFPRQAAPAAPARLPGLSSSRPRRSPGISGGGRSGCPRTPNLSCRTRPFLSGRAGNKTISQSLGMA